MTDVANALTALGITEWVLRGEPTNETEFNSMFRKVTGTDSNGSAIESSDPNDFGTTWSAVSAKKTELIEAEPMKLLREERERRYAATDWWASSDITMSSDRTNYRQALLDLPANQTPTVDGEGALQNVTWPNKPS